MVPLPVAPLPDGEGPDHRRQVAPVLHGGVAYCKPGGFAAPSPFRGVLRLSQPHSPHLSPFSLQTPGAQWHQVHPPRRLLPLQEAAEDVSVQPPPAHPEPQNLSLCKPLL